MKWTKLGRIYTPDGSLSWARSHATCPTPLVLGDVIRIYIQCRDEKNVGRVGFVEVECADPTRVVRVGREPVLDAGRPGTFDENGVFQTSIVPVDDGRLFLYYVGFELGTKIRYRMLTGLAVSRDQGLSFERIRKTPILERSDDELFFRCGPCVLRQDGLFRMWYIGGSAWETVHGKELPVYDMRYIESHDGIAWPVRGAGCLAPSGDDELGFGRPYVLRRGDGLEMVYSIRLRSLGGNYVLGYARSDDGRTWERRDADLGLGRAVTGWDSAALDYGAVVRAGGKTYLFYNGNDYGGTGVGVAVLDAASGGSA